MILVLIMAAPCFGRSKRSQEKLDARHSQAAAAAGTDLIKSRANYNNAAAGYVRQQTRQNSQDQLYREKARASRRAEQQRNTGKRRGSELIGF